MYKYSNYKSKQLLSLTERKERLKKLISGEEVQKPVKPKKPKQKKLKPPGNVFTITRYAWENLDTGELKFCEEEEIPEGFIEITSSDTSLIEEFSDIFEADTNDVLVVPNGDRLEYRAIKHLSKEEYAERKEEYEAEKFNQEFIMLGYQKAMEQYRKDKALWEIWVLKNKGDI